MEIFNSLQGEGYNVGKQAVFIRLAGCDVGCTWCDVKESWNAKDYPVLSVESMLATLAEWHPENVVITGGEPCLYDLLPLTEALKRAGYSVWLETSGSSEIKGAFDHICVSPKKFKSVLKESLARANELKVIVVNKHDLTWAESFLGDIPAGAKCFLQPEWERREKVSGMVIDYILEHPRWQLSLQTHKYLGIR